MKVKQISIKHPELGDIEINSTIQKQVADKIGDVAEDYTRECLFYYSDINKNEDGTFDINKLMVIQPERLDVGWMNNSKGNKGFITVITNRVAGDDITIYPNAIMSVIYNES